MASPTLRCVLLEERNKEKTQTERTREQPYNIYQIITIGSDAQETTVVSQMAPYSLYRALLLTRAHRTLVKSSALLYIRKRVPSGGHSMSGVLENSLPKCCSPSIRSGLSGSVQSSTPHRDPPPGLLAWVKVRGSTRKCSDTLGLYRVFYMDTITPNDSLIYKM